MDRRRRYTEEQRRFFKEYVPGHSYKEIQDAFNRKFKKNITLSQVKSYIKNNRLNTGRTGRFTKGHVPANKGQRGVRVSIATEFKPGHVPHNYKPVGAERVNSYGYVDVKIKDPRTWRGKHLLIYEAHYGPIPKGHVVVFGDGNRRNFDPENLVLVSRAQLAVMNKRGLVGGSAEATRSGKLVADIAMKITERLERSE